MLFRSQRVLSTNPSYLQTAADGQVRNYRDWGIPLGRRFRALKLWFLLRLEGVEALKARLRRDLANAQWLAEQVGAAADRVDLLHRLQAQGLGTIPPVQGAAILDAAGSVDAPAFLALPIDRPAFLASIGMARLPGLLSGWPMPGPAAVSSRPARATSPLATMRMRPPAVLTPAPDSSPCTLTSAPKAAAPSGPA